jgi:predicted nuclease of restriction endonuclease-like (RecB) superfamily
MDFSNTMLKKYQGVVMKRDLLGTAEYGEFVAELKARVLSARVSAARAINRDLILLYWDIGRAIVRKQKELGWGKSVVENLSRDLRSAFPSTTGFSPDNLWRMRQLYAAYSDTKFLRQAVPELRRIFSLGPSPGDGVPKGKDHEEYCRQLVADIPWGHNLLILRRVSTAAQRLYYLRATTQFGWSRNVLLNQIKAGAYERSWTEKKTHNFPAALPDHLAEQADEALKSSYNLEFLGIAREIKERDLEDRLIGAL